MNLVSLTNCKGDWFLNNINPAQGNPKLYVLVNHVGSNASVGEHLAAGGLVVSYNCVNAWTIRPTNHYSDYSLHEGSIDKILFLEKFPKHRNLISKQKFTNQELVKIAKLTKQISQTKDNNIFDLVYQIYELNKIRCER